jgi:phytanoyl-CoA hydroxylase
MIELKTPRGFGVHVPESPFEDPSTRFRPDDHAAIKRYYDDNGFVIVEGLYGREPCTQIREIWEREVKPFPGFMYR